MPEIPLDLAAVRQHILFKQHLDGTRSTADIVQVSRDIAGLHNTGPSTPYLSLFARVPGFSREMLDDAMYLCRSLVRIRCIRNTLHILPRDLVPVAFMATRQFTGINAQRFCKYRGMSDSEYRTVSQQILDLLRDGGRTTAEIKKAIGPVTSLPAALTLLCDSGLLVRGETPNWRSNAYTYHLLSEFLPGLDLDRPADDNVIPRLIELYLSACGPATTEDMAWWTGLGKTAVRDAMKELTASYCTIDGIDGEHIMLSMDAEKLVKRPVRGHRVVNFLPGMDPCIMGYKKRDRYLRRDDAGYVFDRSGNSAPTILVDGVIAGVWDYEAGADPVVKLFLFGDVPAYDPEIRAKGAGMGAFISGRKVRVAVCDAMTPLAERPPGAVLAPLKGQ